jgi:hypothetical protein
MLGSGSWLLAFRQNIGIGFASFGWLPTHNGYSYPSICDRATTFGLTLDEPGRSSKTNHAKSAALPGKRLVSP